MKSEQILKKLIKLKIDLQNDELDLNNLKDKSKKIKFEVRVLSQKVGKKHRELIESIK